LKEEGKFISVGRVLKKDGGLEDFSVDYTEFRDDLWKKVENSIL
jgi:hypothetical protein